MIDTLRVNKHQLYHYQLGDIPLLHDPEHHKDFPELIIVERKRDIAYNNIMTH